MCSCRLLESGADFHKIDTSNKQSYWIEYDATRRGAFIFIDNEGNVKICSEPAPDAAIQNFMKLFSDVSHNPTDMGGKLNVETSSEIISLGKRTENLQFLREALYRLSELTCNTKMSEETTARLFEQTIKIISDITTTDKLEAENSLLKRKSHGEK